MRKPSTVIDLYLPCYSVLREEKIPFGDRYFFDATEAYSWAVEQKGRLAIQPICRKAVEVNGEYYILASEKSVKVAKEK